MLGWGNFGWAKLAHAVSAFTPADLGAKLLQWLTNFLSPDEVEDASDNATNANAVDSPAAVFSGQEYISCGNNWATQNPYYKFKMRRDAGSTQYMISKSGGAGFHEVFIGLSSIGQLTTELWSGGTVSHGFASDAQLVVDMPYEIELFYNRTAGEITQRYRLAGTTPWTTKTIGSIPPMTFTGGTMTTISGYEYVPDTVANKYFGDIYDVEIWDYATTTQLHGYPLSEQSGSTVYDTVGSANGAITTGAGGLAVFWSGLQPHFHYFAENGGTAAVYIEDGHKCSSN